MSQLERQYDELEEFGRQIEQELREAEESELIHSTCSGFQYTGGFTLLLFYSQARSPSDEVLAQPCQREKRLDQEDV